MSNISRLSPYAYLAKRNGNGGNLYDLLLLVPVDASGDTDLSNVMPIKPNGSTRITIDYTTNSSAANVPYRFKHWVIDSEGTYLDIEIQGDNNASRTTLVAFADADTQPATVSSQTQTCAPYLFAKTEATGSKMYLQPSCIVLFDNGFSIQNDAIAFEPHYCSDELNIDTTNGSTDPSKWVINQNVKAALTQGQVYTFEVGISDAANRKPPRRQKFKIIW